MPAASRTIVIDRPIEDVFAFFTDPQNDPKWRPHVKEIAADGPEAVGTVVHQTVAGPGGRGIPADFEVIAYEPPSRYTFRVIAGPVRPVGEALFTAAATGTQVTFSLRAELGGVKKILMTKQVQSAMDAEMAALDKAKALLEQP